MSSWRLFRNWFFPKDPIRLWLSCFACCLAAGAAIFLNQLAWRYQFVPLQVFFTIIAATFGGLFVVSVLRLLWHWTWDFFRAVKRWSCQRLQMRRGREK